MSKHSGKPAKSNVTLEDLARMLKELISNVEEINASADRIIDTFDKMNGDANQALSHAADPKVQVVKPVYVMNETEENLCKALDDLATNMRSLRDGLNGTSSRTVRHYGSPTGGFSSVSASRGNLRYRYQA